ncbi:hypothetical protein ACFY4C_23305 [Actinomadura viridis]
MPFAPVGEPGQPAVQLPPAEPDEVVRVIVRATPQKINSFAA